MDANDNNRNGHDMQDHDFFALSTAGFPFALKGDTEYNQGTDGRLYGRPGNAEAFRAAMWENAARGYGYTVRYDR